MDDYHHPYPTNQQHNHHDHHASSSGTFANPPPSSTTSAALLQQQRKRIAQSACELCRKKRTRCVVDPENPYNLRYADSRGLACNSCISQNIECVFSGVDRRKESVRELRSRLSFLEALFEKLRNLAGNDDAHALREQLEVIKSSKPSQTAINLSISNGYVRGAGAPSLPGHHHHHHSSSSGDAKPSKEALAQALNHSSTDASSSKKRRNTSKDGSGAHGLKSGGAGGVADDSDNEIYSEDEDDSAIEDDHHHQNRHHTSHSLTSSRKEKAAAEDGSPSTPEGSEVGDHFAANLSELVDRLAISTDGSIHAYGATSNIVFSNETTNHTLSSTSDPPESPPVILPPQVPKSNIQPAPSGLPGVTASPALSAVHPSSTSASSNQAIASASTALTSTNASPRAAFAGGRPLSVENANFLPPGTTMQTIQHLLNLYFMWHHLVFPVLSRPVFVEHLCNGGKYASPLLLNVSGPFGTKASRSRNVVDAFRRLQAILAFASGFSDWKR